MEVKGHTSSLLVWSGAADYSAIVCWWAHHVLYAVVFNSRWFSFSYQAAYRRDFRACLMSQVPLGVFWAARFMLHLVLCYLILFLVPARLQGWTSLFSYDDLSLHCQRTIVSVGHVSAVVSSKSSRWLRLLPRSRVSHRLTSEDARGQQISFTVRWHPRTK